MLIYPFFSGLRVERRMTLAIKKGREGADEFFANPDAFQKRSQSKLGVGRNGDGSSRSAGETTRRVERVTVADGTLFQMAIFLWGIRILKPHEMYIVWKRSL
jgi:hypothetical protein